MASRRSRSNKRGFGEISRQANGRFRVRFTGPDGARHGAGRTFTTRMDAEAWLIAQDRLISRAEWKPPERASAKAPNLFEPYARAAVARRRLRPTTVALYEKLLRLAILPTFGAKAIKDITKTDVAHWHASLQSTPTQQANAYGLLKSLLKDALEDELIETNPCRIKGAGQKKRSGKIEILTISQLESYLRAIPENRRVPLMLAGWCGLRSGEVRGLRVRDLDVDAGLIRVRQGVVRLKGRLLIGRPKTDAGMRDIAIPPHLLPLLRAWLASQPVRPDEALLFPAGDGVSPLNDSVLRDAHYRGRAAIGMPRLTIHGLRHTSATLAAQQGATIAELQARIGHSTPTMALLYQHVGAQRDAQLAARMSAAATGIDWTRNPTERENNADT